MNENLIIGVCDSLGFGFIALIFVLVGLIRWVSGRSFRSILAEIFSNQGAGEIDVDELPVEPNSAEAESGRLIDQYFDELDIARSAYDNRLQYGEAGDW